MIHVVNKYKHISSKNDIYIGRGSVLGNPFTSIKDRKTKAEFICNSSEESISSFDYFLREKIKKKDKSVCDELNRIYKLAETEDVFLVCFCKPKNCHGDIIKNIVDSAKKE